MFLVRASITARSWSTRTPASSNAKDLEGKRVGVNRGYTVTTGVWARGILASEYGVDLQKITWVLSGDEHVDGVSSAGQRRTDRSGQEDGRRMLIAGRTRGRDRRRGVDHPDIIPLIPNPLEAGLEALRTRGHYPINHCVVIRDTMLAAHPEVAAGVFEAFDDSRTALRRESARRQDREADRGRRLHRRVMEITGKDPLPYGIAPNRGALEEIVGFATAQGILTKPVSIDELFVPSVRGLTG